MVRTATPMMVKVMDKRGQNQHRSLGISDAGLFGQNSGRHDHMREMARLVVMVAAAIAGSDASKA